MFTPINNDSVRERVVVLQISTVSRFQLNWWSHRNNSLSNKLRVTLWYRQKYLLSQLLQLWFCRNLNNFASTKNLLEEKKIKKKTIYHNVIDSTQNVVSTYSNWCPFIRNQLPTQATSYRKRTTCVFQS